MQTSESTQEGARYRAGEIGRVLGVEEHFDPAEQVERRVAFLADRLRESGARAYVLGISGGVDSTVAGRLAQRACAGAGHPFIAMRLPYATQADEDDARRALEFIEPHEILTVDIAPATDALHALVAPPSDHAAAGESDFVKGNVKARQRMTAQYAVAGWARGLVVGTDHAAEAVMGFFTKYGDGAADVVPLAGLTKQRVRDLGTHLGAPADLVGKVPTADLEDDRPGIPDETVHGVTYDEIDAYLLGRPVSGEAARRIEDAYDSTAHKRALPIGPTS